MPAPVKCGDCKWCCYVTDHTGPHHECHLHPPTLDGMHDPAKPCAWTFPHVNPDNLRVCSDYK
jgi:hypothetical protein